MEHLTVFLSDRDRHILRRMSQSLNRIATALEAPALDFTNEDKLVLATTSVTKDATLKVRQAILRIPPRVHDTLPSEQTKQPK